MVAHRLVWIALSALLVFAGCQSPTSSVSNGGGAGNQGNASTFKGNLTANLAGAKALVTKSASATVASVRGAIPRAATASPLAKILEDGSVADVLATDGTVTLPDIDFIAASPTGEVFIYFKWSVWIANASGSNVEIQFLKINANGSIEVVENNVNIQKFNWSWGAGANQKPVVFNDDGSIFYATWEQNGPVLKRYSAGVVTTLTQRAANVSIEAFFTDGTNLYFVGRNNSEANKAYYLRMVKPTGETKDAFYKGDGNGTWIRAVKRVGDAIYLHAWGIPDPTDAKITYNGLLQVTRDASDNFSIKLVVGYASNTTTSNNIAMLRISRDVFAQASDIDAIVKPFFKDGVVPAGIDYYRVITIDRANTEFQTTFKNNDERYFWYLLLKDADGFDKAELATTDDWGNFPSLFGTSIEETLLSRIMERNWTNFWQIPTDSAVIKADGTVDPVKFMEVFNLGPSRKGPFKSIAVKTGAVLPTRVLPYNNNDISANNKAAKAYLDTYFDYEGGKKALNNPNTWGFLNGSGISCYYFDDDSAKGFDVTTNKWDLALFDAWVKSQVTGGTNSPAVTASFGRKANSAGRKFLPTDRITNDEYKFAIEWEFEKPAGSTDVYDQDGLLGKYRVLSRTPSTGNFIRNFYTGLVKRDLTLKAEGAEGTISSLFASGGPPYKMVSGMLTKNETNFVLAVKERTNATTLVLKDLDPSPTVTKTLHTQVVGTVGNARVNSFSSAERYNTVTFGSGSTTSTIAPTLTSTVDSATSSDENFVRNFFTVTMSNDYPVNDYLSIDLASTWGHKALKNVYNDSNRPTITTRDDFMKQIRDELNAGELKPKVNPTGNLTYDPQGSIVSDDEIHRPIKWEFEEPNSAKLYDRKGVLGYYRVVNDSVWDNANFYSNFFETPVQKVYNLTTLESTNEDLSNFWSRMSDDWANNKPNSLYNGWWSGDRWKWRPSYLNADGSVKTDSVLAYLKRFSPHPAIKLLDQTGYLEAQYTVLVANSSTVVDSVATRKALANAIFDLPSMTTYPAVLSQGVYSYAPDTRWGSATSLDFNNLDNFSVASTGEIFGLFRKDNQSSIYTLARLMTATGEVTQEKLLSNLSASNMQINGSTLYFAGDSGGKWFISSIDLQGAVTGTAKPEALLTEAENLELYRYNVASSLKKLFFTGSNKTTGTLQVGWVETDSPHTIHYQSAAGISSSSDIEVYSDN